MKRHIGEFAKTSFVNSGRAAGIGTPEDKYGDEDFPGPRFSRRMLTGWEPKKEIKEAPVKIYHISREEAEKL